MKTVKSVSHNPNYRPSNPPQVGSQQFNNGYGQSQPVGYSQPNAYGYSQPSAYGTPGAYTQPSTYGYSQPSAYGTPMVMMRPKVNSLSGWALWMGIIGLGGGFVCSVLSMIPIIGYLFSIVMMFLWIAPILAIIFGHVARGQIRRTGEDGQSQATAGLVMGYIGIAFALLMIFVLIGLLGLGFLAMGLSS